MATCDLNATNDILFSSDKNVREVNILADKPTPSILSPPRALGMKILDKSAFEKRINVPVLSVQGENLVPAFKLLKPYLLKVRNIKPVEVNSENEKARKVLLNPVQVQESKLDEFLQELKSLAKESCTTGLNSEYEFQNIVVESKTFTYDNWTYDQLLDSILPDGQDKLSSFSKIGHIVHLNLRDHLLPYKAVIGEILLEKVPGTRTIINKLNIIDSTFRNFKMEVLAGDPDTVVAVKHSRCTFKFDFAQVYWNPRLGTEHERIQKLLRSSDVLYDVFAGVGPFAIPAGRKKVRVLANDLNPQSYHWLQENIKANKVVDNVSAYNLDGREFIQTIVKQDLIKNVAELDENEEIIDLDNKAFHIVMNLPAIAVQFLDAFWNILAEIKTSPLLENLRCIVHVYCFVKGADNFKSDALELVKDSLGFELEDEQVLEVAFVRNVAPNKEMLRVTFRLPVLVLTQPQPSKSDTGPRKRKFSELAAEAENTDEL